jgi:hypothetical protein
LKSDPPWKGTHPPRPKGPPGDACTDYVGVCVADVDCLDWSRSEYERAIDPLTGELIEPPELADITKTVLSPPEGGFPPLFRVAGDPLHRARVSGAARRALRAKKMGVAFEDVHVAARK